MRVSRRPAGREPTVRPAFRWIGWGPFRELTNVGVQPAAANGMAVAPGTTMPGPRFRRWRRTPRLPRLAGGERVASLSEGPQTGSRRMKPKPVACPKDSRGRACGESGFLGFVKRWHTRVCRRTSTPTLGRTQPSPRRGRPRLHATREPYRTPWSPRTLTWASRGRSAASAATP